MAKLQREGAIIGPTAIAGSTVEEVTSNVMKVSDVPQHIAEQIVQGLFPELFQSSGKTN